MIFSLADAVRLEEQPVGEDQQALLAEFDRRRRVSEEDCSEKKKKRYLIRLDNFMFQRMMWK